VSVPEEIRPAETVEAMEDQLRQAIPASVELTLDLSAPDDAVRFDAGELQTVISQLVIVGAQQLRGPGQLKLSVDVEVLSDHIVGTVSLSGDHVVIAVRAEGELAGPPPRLGDIQDIVLRSGGHIEVVLEETRITLRVLLPQATD
jgi:hypothetical protein